MLSHNLKHHTKNLQTQIKKLHRCHCHGHHHVPLSNEGMLDEFTSYYESSVAVSTIFRALVLLDMGNGVS
jgi:hypothetical protein